MKELVYQSGVRRACVAGVRLVDGREVAAEIVVAATGPYTPYLFPTTQHFLTPKLITKRIQHGCKNTRLHFAACQHTDTLVKRIWQRCLI